MRVLRFAIPAVILIIAAIITAAPTFYNRLRLLPVFPIDPTKIKISGTKIVMELPRVNGFTTDRRPYELTARAAAQDLTKLDVLELNELRAQVELRDGQRVDMTAINGVYDTKAEVLKLNDHILITSSSGYEGRLSEATIQINKGNVVSESPVHIKLPNGVLTANRLEITENGAVIKFGGGVELTINPEQLRPATPPDAPPANSGGAANQALPPPAGPPLQTTRRGAASP